jgi:hypothetical protein
MCDSNEATKHSVNKEEDECLKCPRVHELQYYIPGEMSKNKYSYFYFDIE